MTVLTEELSELAGQFVLLVSVVNVPAGSTDFPLVAANPLRWGLYFAAQAGGGPQALVTPGAVGRNDVGFNPNGPTGLQFQFRDNPAMARAAWFGQNSSIGAIPVLVIEELAQQ